MKSSCAARVLCAVSTLVFLGGCGASPADLPDSVGQVNAEDAVATSTATGATLAVQEFPPGESWDDAVQPLIVRVSNQSFDDPDVQLSASLDGVDLFAQSFAVEGQHTVTLFGVDVAPGSHTLTVVSDSGAEVQEAFDLPAGEQRWLVVDYWFFDPAKEGESWGGDERPGPSFSVFVSPEPVYIS